MKDVLEKWGMKAGTPCNPRLVVQVVDSSGIEEEKKRK